MANNGIETRLWSAADQLWANTGLRPAEFSTPVLGLIFLRYAEKRFKEMKAKLLDENELDPAEIEKHDFQAEGVLYLPEKAGFSYLLHLAEGENLGRAIAKQLLDTLKREKLVLDWREKQQARAGVRQTITRVFRTLPSEIYPLETRREKADLTYCHIYDSYKGAGQSIYQAH